MSLNRNKNKAVSILKFEAVFLLVKNMPAKHSLNMPGIVAF